MSFGLPIVLAFPSAALWANHWFLESYTFAGNHMIKRTGKLYMSLGAMPQRQCPLGQELPFSRREVDVNRSARTVC